MSHFTVLVVGENPDAQLAPYQENNMGDCPKEYLSFYNEEDEFLKEYETKVETQMKLLEFKDEWFYSWGSALQKAVKDLYLSEKGIEFPEFPKFPTDEQKKDFEDFEASLIASGRMQRIEKPIRELYATFEIYCDEWHGMKEHDPEMNRYGYWDNPNKKWDWFSFGGRWTGFFKLKRNDDGSYPEHFTGAPGLMTQPAEEGYADQARKSDIDFDGMYADAGNKAEEIYDKFERVTKGLEVPETWESFQKNFSNINEARKAYAEVPWIKAVRKEQLDDFFSDTIELFFVNNGGRESYVNNAMANAISTFAVLKDGNWYERGRMGWWGAVSNETKDWAPQFKALFDSIPDDSLLTVVDCHI